jgi:hypothetical protein
MREVSVTMCAINLPVYLHSRLRRACGRIPETFLHVSIVRQHLSFVKDGELRAALPAATSQFGVGNREGSLQTPPGIHRIKEKIGQGAPARRIFRDRLDTGIDWHESMGGDNLVLTRILRLEGLEPGLNRGGTLDTYDRYVYIHGTNKEHRIGSPLSHGCVCLRNQDIIALFDLVTEGTIVIID